MQANILKALEQSWAKSTSYCPDEWSVENPSRGQCVVSSLIIQSYLGGELRRSEITLKNGDKEKHYFNILPSGEILDSTKSQYGNEVVFEESVINTGSYSSAREKLLADSDTEERYSILFKRVEKVKF